jgi:hypothetical protein
MPDSRRPEAHIRVIKGNPTLVNPDVHYDPDPIAADKRVPSANLTDLAEGHDVKPVFDPTEPLDRDLVARMYGEEWRDASVRAAKALSGYAAAEYEMDPRYVNILVLPGVDIVDAAQSYFFEVARENPEYQWGDPDSWAEEFSFESIMLFDDDALHYTAGVINPDRLAAHGIRVLDTRQAEWLPAYHEYSRRKYSFHAHCEAEPLHLPERPYRPLDHIDAIDEITGRGLADPAEFSVLLWLGEIELRDNKTYAITKDDYDPTKNHIPPWAIEDFMR